MPFPTGYVRPTRPTLIDAFIERVGIEREGRIFEQICQEADNGNWEAITFLGERMYPKKKPSMSIRSSIRDLITLADVEAANTTIINEVASGELNVEGGQALMGMVEKAANAMVKDIIENLEEHQEALKQYALS
jgi:hypothetical protein